MMRLCQNEGCEVDISARYRTTKYCDDCAHRVMRAKQKAARDRKNAGYRPRAGRFNGVSDFKVRERRDLSRTHCAYVTGYVDGAVTLCTAPTCHGDQYCQDHKIKTLPRGHNTDSALALYGGLSR